MSSPKLERIKQRHPDLSVLFDRLSSYILMQTKNEQKYVIPKLAAAALEISDGEAFVLLEMFAENGFLRRVYNVYCRKENALLATVDNLAALDEVAHCDFCNTEHNPLDLKVEIAFSLGNNGVKDLAA